MQAHNIRQLNNAPRLAAQRHLCTYALAMSLVPRIPTAAWRAKDFANACDHAKQSPCRPHCLQPLADDAKSPCLKLAANPPPLGSIHCARRKPSQGGKKSISKDQLSPSPRGTQYPRLTGPTPALQGLPPPYRRLPPAGMSKRGTGMWQPPRPVRSVKRW